ncbi:membrane-associated phospholipid phosphatase [Deinococcus aerius]|uniref:Membrane-associated phospholipid phosphatase n=2 Tax=Deinococcus aerius TaxID=200253 RepID=A0A2I9D2V9_9DEIO|nr:membrane-associated phospholipid phosphatase [Deinococcus aerius]
MLPGMLPNSLQTSLHALAAGTPLLGGLAVFTASFLLFVLAAVLGGIVLMKARSVTWALAARVVVACAATVLLTLVLGHAVPDPRPYLVGHYTPLTQVAHDNGFPSDHTLVAALFTGFILWIDRRFVTLFALGTLAIGLGRLAVGAHHTLDVLGSLLIAGASLSLAAALRLPEAWRRPVLPGRERYS